MLRAGFVAPDFRLPTLDGRWIRRGEYRHRRHLALLFVPPAPSAEWRALLEDLAAHAALLQQENAEVLVVCMMPAEEARTLAAELHLPFPVAIDDRGEAAHRYEATAGAVLALDRFGAPLAVWRPPALPTAHDILSAIQGAELACPECGVPVWSIEGEPG